MDEDWNNFVRNSKIEYYKIGSVRCPAFNNEEIYFTWAGFNHLLRKNRKMRDKSIQAKRIIFYQYAPGILKRSTAFSTHFTNINDKRLQTNFWSLEGRVNGIDFVVIVRQVGSNPKHFFSIFEK